MSKYFAVMMNLVRIQETLVGCRMRKNTKTLFPCFLTAVLFLSLAVFSASVPAQAHGQTRQVEHPSNNKINSVENPADKMSWTAWYKDPRPKYGPEWHASTVDKDGNVIAVGTSADQVSSPVAGDMIVGKFNKDGQMLPGWPKNNAAAGKRFNEGQRVVVDAAGNITVAGYTISDTTPRHWYFTVWRFDWNGDLLPGWPQFPDNTEAYGTGVVIDSNGDIVCCGGNTWTGQMVLEKYLPDGSLVAGWPKTYQVSGQSTFGYSLIQDSDGNYVVAGFTSVAGVFNALLYKLDVNGNVLAGWLKTWHSETAGVDEYCAVSQDTNGDYCLVGVSQGATPASGGRLLVTRYSKDGEQLTSAGWPQVFQRDGYRDNWVDVWRGSVDASGNISASVTCDSGATV